MKKSAIFTLIFIFILTFFSVLASAEESDGGLILPDEYGDFVDSLPEGVVDSLPEGFLSDDPEDVGAAIKEMSSPMALISLLLDGIVGGVKDISPTLMCAIGVVLISAVLSQISSSFKQDNIGGFISRLCIISLVLSLVYKSILLVSEYFTNLCRMASAYLPLSAVLFAIGGNVTTAATSSATFGICLSVCQFIFTYTAIPVFVFSLSLAIVSSFYESKIIASISGAVKKYYTMLLSFVMTVLSISIGSQTFISSKADNAAMRGAKFLFGNFIPVSGGTISSSLGAIASGVELIRGCVGVGGVVVIFMMLIPLVCHISAMKLFFFALEIFLGATGESNSFILQISSLYSYLLGIAAISSSVFILSFSLLGFCASAIR